MMTKCSWKKYGLILFCGALFFMLAIHANVVYAQSSNNTNKAVQEDIDAFIRSSVELTSEDNSALVKKYEESQQRCDDLRDQLYQKTNIWWSVGNNIRNWGFEADDNLISAIGNALDSVWESAEALFSTAENDAADLERQLNYFYQEAMRNASSSERRQQIYSEYLNLKKTMDEITALAEQVQNACGIAQTLEGIDEEETIYKYMTPQGQEVMYVKNRDGTFKVVGNVMNGCVPLPVKLNEGRTCIFCPLFLKIFNAANVMASKSYIALASSLSNVLLVGFALWIAFSLLSKVSSFTKMDAPKYITELLTQIFKVLVAYLLLKDGSIIYEYALGPLLKGGMEFGMLLLSSNNKYLDACTSLGVANMPTGGLLPSYLYVQLECFIKAVQAELAVPQAIGSSLMCVSLHAAGSDPSGVLKYVTDYRLPDLSMLLEGLIIWAFAWLMSLAFAFYLVDATVRLGIVGALMPFLIACWPFKVTSKYTNQGFTMFMNTFFVYVFLGLVISINIQLISVSMTGIPGGKDAVINALNGNQVQVLKDLLDLGFGGFLILIASCIFGFKICGQSSDLAGSMAGGGGGSSIAPEIGGMGYNVAKAATLGTGKAIGNGAKFVGKVGEASGINEKLRKTRDNAVNKLIKQPLAKIFSLGRSSPNASQRMQPSQAPKPQTSPSAGGNGGTPVTPDQTRQADNVVNAAPRPETTPQTASDTSRATTTQQNQRQAQTDGSSGRTASTQANGSTSTQNTQNVLTPEQQREQHIDQFNRSHAATLDLDRSSALYRQISDQCGKATTNRDTAAQKARSFEAQAKEEMDKAKSLREKAQKMVDGAEKDALMQQANTSDKNANDFKAKATEERNKEKENDAIVRETLKKMDDMKQERLKTMSNEDVDKIMKQTYGNNYRADQSANRNGWSFN